MAEKSSFFNSLSGDRKYSAADWAEYFATFISNGVVLKGNATLAVTADGGSMSVSLAPGEMFVNGYRYVNTLPLSLPLAAANASLSRIDSVVIRWDRSQRAIHAAIVTGTPAEAPEAAAPVRTADIYEHCIAYVTVDAAVTSIAQSAITDQRLNSDVCGIATMIGDMDTSDLFNSFQAAFDEWFATARNTLSEDSAGNLLNLINQYKPRVINKTISIWSHATDLGTGDSYYFYTINSTDIPLDGVFVVSAAGMDADKLAYAKAGVYAEGQAEGHLTIRTKDDIQPPTLYVTITIWEK